PGDQRGDGVGGERRGEVEALGHIAVHLLELAALVGILHPHGHQAQPESAAEADDGGKEGAFALVGGHLSMNALGILRASTGRNLSSPSDEYPVPKSSMARMMPRSLSDCRRSRVAAVSSTRRLSVISRVSRDGTMPVSRRTAATSLATVGWRSCTGERLTLTEMGRSGWSFIQRTAWPQAVRSTCSPMPRISPADSAMGMNSRGAMLPRRGFSQRASASAPTTA